MKKKYLLIALAAVGITTLIFAADVTRTKTNTTNGNQFTPAQTQQIEQIIHNYLVKNPQVLVEVSQSLQQQQMAEMQKVAAKAIEENKADLFSNPNSPVVGNPKGTVTLIEFMDYQCAHCKEMAPVIDALIKANPNLRVVYKELPIFGATSQYAAKAALAAVKQGKYAAFHEALMKDQNPLTKDEVTKLATAAGLNTDQITKDMESDTIAQQLKDNLRLAQALGLMGTPAIIIGGSNGKGAVFIPGTANQQNLQQVISQVK